MSNYSDFEIESSGDEADDTFIWHVDSELIDEEISDLRATITTNDNQSIITELFDYIRCNSNHRIVSLADLVQEADHDYYVKNYYASRNFSLQRKSEAESKDIAQSERNATSATSHHVGLWVMPDRRQIYVDDSFLDDHGNLQRIYRLWKLRPDPTHLYNMVAILKNHYRAIFDAVAIPKKWLAVPHRIIYTIGDKSVDTTVKIAPRENPVDVAFYMEHGAYPHNPKYREVPVIEKCELLESEKE